MISQSFSKENRILNSKEFSDVFDRAQYRVGCSEFLVLAIDSSLSSSRMGMVVGKKNTRLAVNRNKSKRIFRESFRKIAISMFSKDCLDIVIITRPGVIKCSSEELFGQLSTVWLKLREKVSKVRNSVLAKPHCNDQTLSIFHQCITGSKVPVLSELLTLHDRSYRDTRCSERFIPGDEKNHKVSSIPSGWNRHGPSE